MTMPDWLKDGLETLAHLTTKDPWETWEDRIKFGLGMATFVLATWLVYKEFLRCFRLLRRVHHTTPRGGFFEVARTMIRLAWTDRSLLSLDRQTLSRRTRILIEHELLAPTPKPMRDWRNGGNWLTIWWAYLLKSRAWWRSMRPVLRSKGQLTIHLENPSLLNARIDDINRYFECLASLGYEGGEGDRFICLVEVKTGFIAPLHLLTGLYAKFDKNWGPIIRTFDHDSDAGSFVPQATADRDLRQIQLFIYNCWLLWGPSIPICECRNWRARYSVIQYGFGDENNSIELVGETTEIKDGLAQLMRTQESDQRASDPAHAGENRPTAMAIPANVTGRLRLSGSLRGRPSEQVNALPSAALTSWGGLQHERPLLFITEISYTDALAGNVESQASKTGRIAEPTNASRSLYYSAYLWVAIVVLFPTPQGLVPLSSTRPKPSQPWKDFIPFFEHGNLADPESCIFGKRQLAAKVVLGLAAALKGWSADREPLHFAFASSIDEPGCGHPLAHPKWNGFVTMPELIGETLEDLAKTNPDVKRLRDLGLLHMDHFSGGARQYPFSSCAFPEIISEHYKVIEATSADLRS